MILVFVNCMVAVEPVGVVDGTVNVMRANGIFSVVNVWGGLPASSTGMVQRIDTC